MACLRNPLRRSPLRRSPRLHAQKARRGNKILYYGSKKRSRSFEKDVLYARAHVPPTPITQRGRAHITRVARESRRCMAPKCTQETHKDHKIFFVDVVYQRHHRRPNAHHQHHHPPPRRPPRRPARRLAPTRRPRSNDDDDDPHGPTADTTSSAATHATPPSTHRRPATTAPPPRAAARTCPVLPSVATASVTAARSRPTRGRERPVARVGAVPTPTLTGGGRARRGGRRARTLRRRRGAWGRGVRMGGRGGWQRWSGG